MAATKRNAMLIEEAREKIKTTQLINRLQNHALGAVEMSPTQVRAIEILLKKRIPDLTSVEAKMDADVRHYDTSDKPLTNDEWERQYAAGDHLATAGGASESVN